MNNTLIYEYLTNEKENYKNIMEQFIEKNIELDNTRHTREEQEGLTLVYERMAKNFYPSFLQLKDVLMLLNFNIFSKTKHPATEFRKCNACIQGSDVQTKEPRLIEKELIEWQELYNVINQIKEQIKLKPTKKNINQYIQACIMLKCKVVEIHPFNDANGRTSRALLNNLFKEVELPPVCIVDYERDAYIKCMDKAIRLNNYTDINKFYYNKLENTIKELNNSKRR